MESKHKDAFNSDFFKNVLDQMYTNIYITDLETDEIIYMNEHMKQAFHLEEPEGLICWKALQKGQMDRCSFCRKEELIQGKSVSIWNEENSLTGRIYQNHDSLIQWKGKTYHMQNSADVTEYQHLREEASIDELTRMYNRRAGKEMLEQMMQQAREKGLLLTVALYDVNDLKYVNDQYGHVEGDHLLRYIAEGVKGALSPQDMVFRLSGDEFVIVFYEKGLESARKKICHILEWMKLEKERYSMFYEASFSYGMIEVYPEDNYSSAEIIDKADAQMYIQKRSYHIRRAQESLEKTQHVSSTRFFEYDKEHLYDALMDSTDDYTFVGNMQTGKFQYSPSMAAEFGLPGEIVENAAAFWGKLIHPHDAVAFLESNQEIADGRVESHCIEYRAKNVRNEWIWLRCRGRMIRNEQGEPSMLAGFISNLGQNESVDHITGLPGRFSFEGDIKKQFVKDGEVSSIGLMALDMDCFKNINELYDRSFGDEILRITAHKIADLLPQNAKIYRLDGDEFGIVLSNEKDDECEQIYKAIYRQFQNQQEYARRKYYSTISAGYASYPKDAKSYLELLKCANCSLEYSKLNGKNRFTRFSQELMITKERNLDLMELLRESIERGFSGFSVRYQPQVDAKTGELIGAEALARWRCSKYGAVSPGEFIPLLEQSGLILQMGKWIFEEAASECSRLCEMQPDFKMSINLSNRQLEEGDFTGDVKDTLERLNLAPSSIILELTETYLMKADEEVRKKIDSLRKYGILLAMDDFGIGYSSLGSLKNIPVDIVKIDRTFVDGISADLLKASFIKDISQLCHDVGKRVCLEGIETKEEYEAIKDAGLEQIQGFYFGYPETEQAFRLKWFQIDD